MANKLRPAGTPTCNIDRQLGLLTAAENALRDAAEEETSEN